ncbi:MAG: ribosome biogenesis factor YjgA [Methylophilaceae bacterium]
MKPNKTDDSQMTDEITLEPISKTKRKAAMDALQDIGEKLIELPKEKLAKLDLPERLLDAVREAKRITAHGATRRQKQYIGSLMRDIDVAPIVDQLQRWEGKHSAENAHFHQLERWRERLIADEAALPEFMQQYPKFDIQQLRTLTRNARREAATNKPPKSSRELFKLLREISESESPGKEGDV